MDKKINNNYTFIKILKKYTNIDKEFIDIFFKKFKIGQELNFEIKDIDVANYLNITVDNLRRRLQNKYSKYKKFIENDDFIKIKINNKKNSKMYMLNYPCFEKITMSGDSEKCESVRMYFIKIRQFITENQNIIFQSIEKKDELKKLNGYEMIYFFALDINHDNIIKIGRTNNILQRLRNYNVGRIKEIDLKYLAIVKNYVLVEKCIKLKIKKNQIFENKEIYEVNPDKLKKIIDKCYCKFISHEKNEEMYEDISNLISFYSYTKNKKKIKPYVIISK